MGGISLQVWAKRERWFRISKADVVRVCVMSFDLGIITVSKVFMNFFEKINFAKQKECYINRDMFKKRRLFLKL